MTGRIRNGPAALGILAITALGGCDNVTVTGFGSAGDQVVMNLRIAGGGDPAPAQIGGPVRVVGPPMTVAGTNGSLTIEEIRIVIDEVELHREGPECDGVEDGGGDCGEFESGPRFLDLPLDGELIEAFSAVIPAGTYDRLDFEIEDLEDDADNPDEAARIAAVRDEILAVVPDWPRKASALVTGSFTPTDGDAVDFRVFLEAEIEIELDLLPNLVVDGAGTRTRDLTVDLDPRVWFSNPDGSVLELPDYDYDATGDLLELEVEMEHGFAEVEFDD